MSNYIANTLSKNEKIIGLMDLHWSVYALPTLKVLLTISVALIAIFYSQASFIAPIAVVAFLLIVYFLIPVIKLSQVEMGMTSHRLIKKQGVLARMTEEMRHDSIETVEVKQTMMGRLFNYGNLEVTGKGVSDIMFEKVNNPVEVKIAIENILNK